MSPVRRAARHLKKTRALSVCGGPGDLVSKELVLGATRLQKRLDLSLGVLLGGSRPPVTDQRHDGVYRISISSGIIAIRIRNTPRRIAAWLIRFCNASHKTRYTFFRPSLPMNPTSSSILLGLLFAPSAALAHNHQVMKETCRAYRHTETYKPGHYNAYATWINGRVERGSVPISCPSYGTPAPVAYGHHPSTGFVIPQQQAQPFVVKNQATAPQQQRCAGTLALIGLGGILGGVLVATP